MRSLILILIVLIGSTAYSAELLLYNQDHWSVAAGRTAEFPGRYIKGDIVDPARPNGYYATELNPTGRGWNKDVFKVVRIPLNEYQARNFNKPLYDYDTTPGQPVIASKRQWYMYCIQNFAVTETKVENVTDMELVDLFQRSVGNIDPP